MAFIFLLLALLVICAAAPLLGVDSRRLDDHRNEVDWDRLPR